MRDEAEWWSDSGKDISQGSGGELLDKHGRCDIRVHPFFHQLHSKAWAEFKRKNSQGVHVCVHVYPRAHMCKIGNENTCVTFTNLGTWKELLSVLAHPAEERRLKSECLLRGIDKSVPTAKCWKRKALICRFANYHGVKFPMLWLISSYQNGATEYGIGKRCTQ